MRICTKCNQTKPFEEFSQSKNEKQAVQYHCKDCNKVYREQKKDQVKNYQLKRKFGISFEEYHKMLAAQKGVCKICGQVENYKLLAVDHCHTTGHIRGLLCGSCNRGIGYFRDSQDLLLKAIEYLNEKD